MESRAQRRQPPILGQLPGLFRPRDLDEIGIPRGRLRAMLRHGEAVQVARGLYRLHSAPATEHETIAMVCRQVPRAIVCLLTALHVHGIGTQAPREIWIALDRKARKPRIERFSVRIVRFSGPMLRYGVETREIQGVPVRITSPVRTVVDCFRYRRKIGLDVALEALRDALRSRRATVDEILRVSEVCRVRTVIEPYVESMAS